MPQSASFGPVEAGKVTNKTERGIINRLNKIYPNPADFFIQRLSEGVGTIAAAFYPRPVAVRMSDFKNNEDASLIGGSDFEPVEDNPMIGFRGASHI